MYRVWGGEAGQLGSWLTPVKPVSSAAARATLALPAENAATVVSEVVVPAGTRFQIGTAGAAFGQPGGQSSCSYWSAFQHRRTARACCYHKREGFIDAVHSSWQRSRDYGASGQVAWRGRPLGYLSRAYYCSPGTMVASCCAIRMRNEMVILRIFCGWRLMDPCCGALLAKLFQRRAATRKCAAMPARSSRTLGVDIGSALIKQRKDRRFHIYEMKGQLPQGGYQRSPTTCLPVPLALGPECGSIHPGSGTSSERPPGT